MKQRLVRRDTSIKDRVVAGIFLDRDFDVPISVYEELTDKSASLILSSLAGRMLTEELIIKYSKNEHFVMFFTYLREMIRGDYHAAIIKSIDKIDTAVVEIGRVARILIYNSADWNKEAARLSKSSWRNVQPGWLMKLLVTALRFTELQFQWVNIYNALTKNTKNGSTPCDIFANLLNQNVEKTAIVQLAYMVNADTNYGLTVACRELGIPVLYHEYDATNVVEYVKCVLDSGYRGRMDSELENQLIKMREDTAADIKPVCGNLLEIGRSLNLDNLKYYYIATNETESDMNFLQKTFAPTTTGNTYRGYHNADMLAGYVKDFKSLITMIGNKPAGFPIALQLNFLKLGGDVTTMFDDNGKLLPEASILNAVDQLTAVMVHLSTNTLRFLLLNCPEFVKCIMLSRELTVHHYLHIARALLVNPVDEELWNLVNNEESPTDYRAIILNRIVSIVGIDSLFDNVPMALMYFEPSVLYITRHASSEMIPFIPVHKITQYLKQYIARGGYVKLNLLCKGERTTISSAIGDPQFMIMDIIVKGGKYGYICDLTNHQESIPELIDKVVELIQERQDN